MVAEIETVLRIIHLAYRAPESVVIHLTSGKQETIRKWTPPLDLDPTLRRQALLPLSCKIRTLGPESKVERGDKRQKIAADDWDDESGGERMCLLVRVCVCVCVCVCV